MVEGGAERFRRSPYGERGLKFDRVAAEFVHALSLSLRRAWIEMTRKSARSRCWWSLSLRRAWIEIRTPMRKSMRHHVALLTESVD